MFVKFGGSAGTISNIIQFGDGIPAIEKFNAALGTNGQMIQLKIASIAILKQVKFNVALLEEFQIGIGRLSLVTNVEFQLINEIFYRYELLT